MVPDQRSAGPDGLEDLARKLPPALEPIVRLAINLRWVWNHAADRVWEAMAAEIWRRTGNPILVIQNAPRSRLEALAANAEFVADVRRLDQEQSNYLSQPSWFEQTHALERPLRIAYFSMEYGITEALPLYSGGLGVLAGDHLKTASDLGVPLTGVGLFYREGYFRQMFDASGEQLEIFAVNARESLPVRPVLDREGMPLRVLIELPGRDLQLRLWRAVVGRVDLYLLDSDDPLNSPFDRGITAQLYGDGGERRLLQEIVLGVGGWRALHALGLTIDVCHLNEGHAAFATVERARVFLEENHTDFFTALWATRAGNVFTTHTPIAAAFDTFAPDLLWRYGPEYAQSCRLTPEQLVGLGKANPRDPSELFNMAYLAARTCARINGVSELHGRVSRRIFAPLYPRWPESEVPVSHVTNAVHVPSWDSRWADRVWTEACGKGRWLGDPRELGEAVSRLSDEAIWEFRAEERRDLVEYVRVRLEHQLGHRTRRAEALSIARQALDPNVLTLGFARRFTEYKRPAMLLGQPARLRALLTDTARPVQLIIAGKAHPRDDVGRRFVQQWWQFVERPDVHTRVVFLEDYDMALAERLVQGVDVWINTPRRPWEASGTSGMKVLVNGGLNLSELDGWWAEAYTPDVGWAIGDGQEHSEPHWDAVEAEELFSILEQQIVPRFYDRDADGIPRAWVARIRASLAQLAPRFSSNRMLAEYLDGLYLPAAATHWKRGLPAARELSEWYRALRHHWGEIHWGNVDARSEGEAQLFSVQVYLGEISPDAVQVQLYADADVGAPAECHPMTREHALAGAAGGFVYVARLRKGGAPQRYTPRVVASHPAVRVPAEANFIRWYPR